MLMRTFDWNARLSLEPQVQFISETSDEAVALTAKYFQGCDDLVECEIVAGCPVLPGIERFNGPP